MQLAPLIYPATPLILLSELQTSFLIPSSQITLKKKKSNDKGVFQHCTFFQFIGLKKITW
jgi:hypothetical protein